MNATVPLVAAVALGLAACDLSQKKPETLPAMIAAGAVANSAPLNTRAGAAGMQTPGREGTASAESAGNERSVRLYGPGVSRKRQTRI